MAATIPSHLIKEEPKRISELGAGETVYLGFSDMQVNEAGECFLRPDASVSPGRSINQIRIRRDEQGFHVTLVEKGLKFRITRPDQGAIPVQTITITAKISCRSLASRGNESYPPEK